MEKLYNLSYHFPYILKKFRQEAGLTQVQLSEQVGVSPSFIGMLESGRKKPSLDMLFQLADALGIRASALLAAMEKERERQGR